LQEGIEVKEGGDIVDLLKEWACPAGEPWTGDEPDEDHGHSACWLMYRAVDEIEYLRSKINACQILLRMD
jgi:hypothetical protein